MDILAALTAPQVKEIKINNQNVYIKALTVGEQKRAFSNQKKKNDDDVVIDLLAMSLCDADGKLQITAKNKNIIDDMAGNVLKSLFDEIIEFNGMMPEGKDAKQDTKKKN